MSKEYDAIIIGAGSVGCPLAYFLAKEGFKTLVLDKRPASGQGENKAAIGGVRATHSDPAKIKICQTSLDIFSKWEDKYGVDIGWKKGGYCFPVFREQEEKVLKSILPIQKSHDLNIDWVDNDRVQEVVPGINSQGLVGGTFSPDDGMVSPLLATEAFTNAAKDLRVEFQYNQMVKDITVSSSNSVESAKTQTDAFHAPIIVNTAGANAREIGNMTGLELPITPDSHEAGISAAVKPFLGPLVVDLRPGPEGKTSNFYFGQLSGGQFIFCYTPSKLFIGENRESTSEFIPIISRRLVDLIPKLKNLLIRRVWRGCYPMTPDGVPIVGKAPGIEGLYLGVGMCGQGFMMGPGTGKNLANIIAKGKPLIEPDVFDLLSPERDFYAEKVETLK